MMHTVREVMTPEVKTVSPGTTLKDAARYMKKLNVGVLPVVEGNRPVGVITDRDMIVRAVADNRRPDKWTVRDAMTPEVIHCYDDQDLREVATTMKDNQVLRLLVFKRDNTLAGICSLSDIATDEEAAKLSGEVLGTVHKRSAKHVH